MDKTMDIGIGDARDAVEAWVGKLVAIAGGVWAIWKGTKFAAGRIRQVWKTLSAFADSIEALEKLTIRIQRIEAEQHINFALSEFPRWIADAKGSCIEANAPYLRLLGLSESEAIGSGWESAIHPDDSVRVMNAWEDAVSKGTSFRQRFRMRNALETIYVEAKAVPIRPGKELSFLGAMAVLNRKPITKDEARSNA